MLGRSPLFLSGVRCVRRTWWLWAQGLETRRNCGIGFSVPRVPGTNVLTVAWPQDLRGCHHIRVITSKMGHSLRDARVLGLSPLSEHTSKGKESDREIWGPLHYAASDSHPCTASMPQPSPQTFSNRSTPRRPHSLCLCGLFSVKALTLGQDL